MAPHTALPYGTKFGVFHMATIGVSHMAPPEINAKNLQRRQAAERTAINAPMQGSAADIIKRAMIKVDRWLTMSQVDARMIMQVHDELVLEVKEKEQARVTGVLKQYMSTAADLKIPLVVETGVGKNWDDAH